MNAFLHFPADRRRLICEEGQQKLGLPPASIEKDFWVCWTLRELFGLSEWEEHLTFKGGTSLSKGWRLISRFSEDIDVVIDREYLGFGGDSLSAKQRKRLVKTCGHHIAEELEPALERRFQEAIPDGMKWRLTPADREEDPDLTNPAFPLSIRVPGAPGLCAAGRKDRDGRPIGNGTRRKAGYSALSGRSVSPPTA